METNESTVSVALIVPEGEIEEVIADIESSGGKKDQEPAPYELPLELSDLFGDQQFDPLTIIEVALSVVFLLQRIGRVWRDMSHQKGVIIDARKVPVHVLETAALDRGEVLILRENATESFGIDRKDEAIDAMKAIFGE